MCEIGEYPCTDDVGVCQINQQVLIHTSNQHVYNHFDWYEISTIFLMVGTVNKMIALKKHGHRNDGEARK